MILIHHQEQSTLLQRLFWTGISSANEFPIIHGFITNLEEYINHNGLCSDTEYPFTIIGKNSLNLSPLGLTQDQLIEFCKQIRSNQDNLDQTLSNYMIALNNSSMLDQLNDKKDSNAAFIIRLYKQNPLHIKILTMGLDSLRLNPYTSLEVRTLIEDPSEMYWNLLNLDNEKDEATQTNQDDYSYWDL